MTGRAKWRTRLAAVRAIGSALEDDPSVAARSVEALGELATDRQWEVRLAVAQAAAVLPVEMSDPIAQRLAGDGNEYVRRAATRLGSRRVRDGRDARESIDLVARDLDRLRGRHGEAVSRSVIELADRKYAAYALETNHELKTAATSVLQSLRRLRDALASEFTSSKAHKTVRRNMERSLGQAALLVRMLEDSHALVADQPLRLEVVRVETLIAELLELVDPVRRLHDVQLRVSADSLADELVEVPRARLLQALSSLVKNAIEATRARGEGCERGDETVDISVTQIGEWLEILIEDRGQGMDEADVRRALLPLRTTKHDGEHTGIGLPLARRIIERECGGDLRIDSVPDSGTRVQVLVGSLLRDPLEAI